MTQYTIKAFMLESVHTLHHDHLITFQCFKANPHTGWIAMKRITAYVCMFAAYGFKYKQFW